MKIIHKVILNKFGVVQYINLPYGYKVLYIAEQSGLLCMWIEIDTSHVTCRSGLWVSGTGYELPVDVEHIGTACMVNGLVWHVYKVKD